MTVERITRFMLTCNTCGRWLQHLGSREFPTRPAMMSAAAEQEWTSVGAETHLCDICSTPMSVWP